jgi:hypothetical protein
MGLVILFSILFVVAVCGIYLNRSWRQYYKGLSDGRKGLFARSNTPWYRRGYEAGLSDVAKSKILKATGQQPSLTAVIHADPNGKYYTRYRLINEGPNKGMYESIPTFFTTRTYTRDTIAEAERRDIYESGFAVHAPDPKSSK